MKTVINCLIYVITSIALSFALITAPASGGVLSAALGERQAKQLTIARSQTPIYYSIASTPNPRVICALKCNPLTFRTEVQFVDIHNGTVVNSVNFNRTLTFGYIRFSKSGDYAAYGTMRGDLYLLKGDLYKPVLLKKYPYSMPPVGCWSSDGKLLTAAVAKPVVGRSRRLQVEIDTFNVAKREIISQLGRSDFGGMAPNSSGGFLVAKGSDVYGYLPPSPYLHRYLHCSGGPIVRILPVQDLGMIVTVQNSKASVVISSLLRRSGKRKWKVKVRYSPPFIGVSSPTKRVAVLRQNGEVTLYDLQHGNLVRTIRLPRGRYASGIISRSGRSFYGLAINGTIAKVDIRSGRLFTVRIHGPEHRKINGG